MSFSIKYGRIGNFFLTKLIERPNKRLTELIVLVGSSVIFSRAFQPTDILFFL